MRILLLLISFTISISSFIPFTFAPRVGRLICDESKWKLEYYADCTPRVDAQCRKDFIKKVGASRNCRGNINGVNFVGFQHTCCVALIVPG